MNSLVQWVWPLKYLFEDCGLHRDSNSQSGRPFGVCGFIPSHSWECKCVSWVALPTYTFPCFGIGREPKAKAMTPHLLQLCLCAMWDDLLPAPRDMHFFLENLIVISTPSLQAYLMDIHHDTSHKSILEGDFIPWMYKVCICSCLSKGASLWLVIRPYICSFYITHFTFTSALCFRFNLNQPSASNLLTC
jgi:hypothetical protein